MHAVRGAVSRWEMPVGGLAALLFTWQMALAAWGASVSMDGYSRKAPSLTPTFCVAAACCARRLLASTPPAQAAAMHRIVERGNARCQMHPSIHPSIHSSIPDATLAARPLQPAASSEAGHLSTPSPSPPPPLARVLARLRLAAAPNCALNLAAAVTRICP